MIRQSINRVLKLNPLNVLKRTMQSYGIVPDPQNEETHLTVKYNGKKLSFGQELTPLSVKDQPEVTWEADASKLYLLSMVDPDAPNKTVPIFREVNHWLVLNIPGNKIEQGDVVAEYLGAGPPKNTGLHRYIFLIFEQKEKINLTEPTICKFDLMTRLRFNIKKFAKKHDLGTPQFGNYFKAQWDPWVEQRRKLHRKQQENA